MSTPFQRNAGPIVIPTRLWGPCGDTLGRFALDTGAVCSMVNWDTALLVGYDPASVTDMVAVTTASGVVRVPRFPVQKMSALGHERRGLLVLCHALPAGTSVDGLLGLNFLRGQRLVVDFRTGHVELD